MDQQDSNERWLVVLLVSEWELFFKQSLIALHLSYHNQVLLSSVDALVWNNALHASVAEASHRTVPVRQLYLTMRSQSHFLC
jgi:hypothetical protein